MSAGHHAAPFQDALAWLDLHLGWHERSAWMPLERSTAEGPAYTDHHQPGSPQLLVRWVQHADLALNEEVRLGLPRQTLGGSVTVCTALWAVVEGKEQAAQLARFRPAPGLVLREGASSRRTALWPLRDSWRWADVLKANKRIAYRLRSVQKWSDPDVMVIPAPGSCLRVGRSRPAPVVVEALTLEQYGLLDVVGRLKDPPEQDWQKIRDNARRGI